MMALTVNDVLDQLKIDQDDDAAKHMELHLLSATSIVKKLTGSNFNEDDDQVKLVIILFCEYFACSTDDAARVINGDFLPPQIRSALSGIYVPLVV